MTKIRFELLFPLNSIFTFLFYRVARYTPCISSLAALERHLKRNDRGEETRTSLQFLEPQINLIQGYMTTNINITQTWWRLI